MTTVFLGTIFSAMNAFRTLVLLASLPPACVSSATSQNAANSELPKLAVAASQLTTPGATPFHIKMQTSEATNPANDAYNAEIEEYWIAPDKWRRTIKSAGFSQTLIVNGDRTEEQLTGTYYPNWLRTLIDATLDPGAVFEGLNLSPTPDPRSTGDRSCSRFSFRVGISPVSNRVFAGYCFRDGLIESAGTPGYDAYYSDYRKFNGKQVAYRIVEHIDPGEDASSTITELSEIKQPDESLFKIEQPTSQLKAIQVTEETLRELVSGSPDIKWPPVRGGKTLGVLSIYVCLDRAGHVQETLALNSDHPDMTDAARQQVANWTFKTAAVKGEPVQAEGILTFAYETRIEDPYPVLNNEEARKRAINLVEPNFPANTPHGTIVSVRALVSEEGKVITIGKISGTPISFVVSAIEQWKFQPYLRDGKPTAFNADLTFIVK